MNTENERYVLYTSIYHFYMIKSPGGDCIIAALTHPCSTRGFRAESEYGISFSWRLFVVSPMVYVLIHMKRRLEKPLG